MNDAITVVGRLGGDPTLKSVGGDRVAEFRLASKVRRKEGETWVDAHTNWFSVEAWGRFAQHVVDSLRQGDVVVVLGRLKIDQWESGDRRGTSVKIRADHIGHTLRTGAVAKDRREGQPHIDDRSPSTPERVPQHEPEPAMAGAAELALLGAHAAPLESWNAPLAEPETPL